MAEETEVAEDEKRPDSGLPEQVGAQLLRELTASMVGLRKDISVLTEAIDGTEAEKPGEEDQPGLIERIEDLGQTVDELDTHVTGLSVLMTRRQFVEDQLLELKDSDPGYAADLKALEELLARARESSVEGILKQTLEIMNLQVRVNAREKLEYTKALHEFDRKMEQEEREEEERRKAEESAAAGAAAPAEPPKPPMLSNSPPPAKPGMKALPAPPRMAPPPAGKK